MSTATTLIRHRFSVRRLPRPTPLPAVLPPQPGEILLLTGHSGSGKSTLLRQIASQIPPAQQIDLATLQLPNRPVVDILPQPAVEERLRLLARVGLAEVHSWLRTPRQLSDGQRWRLRLAIALSHAQHTTPAGEIQPNRKSQIANRKFPLTLVCDEYAATLDTLSALIVSQTLRKTVHAHPSLSALLATGREELLPAVSPDRLIHCDFDQFKELRPRMATTPHE